MTAEQGIANYNKAATAGIVSIMSKMGISTVQSYHSAQIFEAVGFTPEFVNAYFAGTVSRVGGMGVEDVEREQNERYDAALAILKSPAPDQLPTLGLTKWRPLGGEDHLIDPQTVYLLQTACREDSYDTFKEYSARLHRTGRAVRLRDLLDFDDSGRTPVPLDEVEPALSIVRRFNTGAMSYGSISKEAHECMAIAMNRLHGRSNSGEGGEDPRRETPLANGDSKNSAIKQVASARFGVTSRYLCSAFEIQIKMAQGAKPGEGGHLPGKKVYPWIAEVRQSTPGIGLISPPPHHDIYSIEDLAELIFDLKNANPGARVSVKLVSEAGVGTIAAGVAKVCRWSSVLPRPSRRCCKTACARAWCSRPTASSWTAPMLPSPACWVPRSLALRPCRSSPWAASCSATASRIPARPASLRKTAACVAASVASQSTLSTLCSLLPSSCARSWRA